jgi:hypothetical protein
MPTASPPRQSRVAVVVLREHSSRTAIVNELHIAVYTVPEHLNAILTSPASGVAASLLHH